MIEAIERVIDKKLVFQVETGTVKSIDEKEMTCEIEIQGKPNVIDVRIKSIIDEKDEGVLIYPAVGSYVLVGLINNKKETSFICGYSKVDKVRWLIPDVEFNGENHGGIAKTKEASERIKRLEDEVEKLKTQFNTHTHVKETPLIPIAASPTAPPVPQTTPGLTPRTTQDYISNNTVRHGG